MSEHDSVASDIPFRDTVRYKRWRKHLRDQYSHAAVFEQVWPSATVEFFPFVKDIGDKCEEHLILTGTQTGEEEQAHLKILSLVMPRVSAPLPPIERDRDTGELGGYGCAPPETSFHVSMRAYHNGDVITARLMPQNPHIIASSSSDGNVYLFDRARIPLTRPPNTPARPLAPTLPPCPFDGNSDDEGDDDQLKQTFQRAIQERDQVYKRQERWDSIRAPGQHILTLRTDLMRVSADHHAAAAMHDGMGIVPVIFAHSLLWNAFREASLAALFPNGVLLYSLDGLTIDRRNDTIGPINSLALPETRDGHWKDEHTLLLLTDHSIVLWDTRTPTLNTLLNVSSLTETFNDFHSMDTPRTDTSHTYCEELVLGTRHGSLHHIHLRKPSASPPSIQVHSKDSHVLIRLSDRGRLLSAGTDGNVNMLNHWTRSSCFVHTAHTAPVSDVVWSPHVDGMVASVDDHYVCVWRPRSHFLALQQ